ncbi:hypothetical protein Nepgr_028525 [Nepenthes gracilis]|uniref:Uncharacterized protein n=1 Tax=Nepenthes gracilis TaxID=150966 RepID=A0AAD3Y273_NEPGR|nr:hypothetical protein Nepgr_028525 [Nepenthes gracilis]
MVSVADFSSDLRENDIKTLCVEFNIPKWTAWRVPGEDDKALSPPEGYITVYEAHLMSGLRLPLPEEFESIMTALMSGLKVIFKVTQGAEWISLSTRTGIKINKAIHDSLKNWKNRFFFVNVGEKWLVARNWGKVPKVHLGTPSATEIAACAWLTKAIRLNPDEFREGLLGFHVETKKAKWGPPSPVQKPHPLIKMVSPEISKKLIIRPRSSEEATERVTATPSSSSSQIDLVAARICGGLGTTSRAERSVEDRLADAGGVILAQPAGKLVPGAAWMGSAEEPAHDVPEGSHVYIVEPSTRVDPPAAAPKASRGRKPAATTPVAAGEESAAAVDDDEFLDCILDEAAACSALEGAPGSTSPIPSPAGPSLKSRPVRPYRKTYEIAALDAIVADVETENATLKVENAELKAEVARLKEEDDRLKASNKRLADRAAAAENELASRMTPHEVGAQHWTSRHAVGCS